MNAEQSSEKDSPLGSDGFAHGKHSPALPLPTGRSHPFSEIDVEDSDIKVIGGNKYGDKAAQLILKTNKIRERGLSTPLTTVLGQEVIDEYLRENGIADSLQEVEITDNTPEQILAGEIPVSIREMLRSIVETYGEISPGVCVRSSAAKDSRGTGTYTSPIVGCTLKEVEEAFQVALSKYFDRDSMIFRQVSGARNEFGLILQPLEGQPLEIGYAPVLSGHGYTSTPKDQEVSIDLVPGHGGAVEARQRQHITATDLGEYKGDLLYYLSERAEPWTGDENLTIRVFSPDNSEIQVFKHRTPENYMGEKVFISCYGTEAAEFLETLAKLEIDFDGPQYFEWTMTLEGDGLDSKPVFNIVQIDDIQENETGVAHKYEGELMLEGRHVVGNRQHSCRKIAVIHTDQDLHKLEAFNKDNDQYVLIYASHLVSSYLGLSGQKLAPRHFSQASTLLELPVEKHAEDPIAHFGGQLESMRKNFAVVTVRASDRGKWDKNLGESHTEHGLQVFSGPFQVTVNEAENQLVLSRPKSGH